MSLWVGQAVSDVGSAITLVVFPLLAVTVLDASTFQLGLLSALSTIGWLLVALPAGVIVDRSAKRRLMVWCDILRLLVVGSVPLGVMLGQLTIWHVYVACVALGILTVVFEVAGQSLTPAVLSPDELVAGNARLFTTNALATTVGPPLAGGLMMVVSDPSRVLVLDSLSFAVSIVSLSLIRSPEPRPHRAGGSGQRFRDEIGEGMRFVLTHPVLRRVVACSAVTNMFNAVTMVLVVVLLVRELDASEGIVGLVLGIGAIGGVAGGIVANPLARRFGSAKLLWQAKVGLGGFVLLIPLAQPGWGLVLACVGLVAMNTSFVLYNVLQISYRQAACPPELLGRMNASVRWIIRGAIPLGGLLAGTLGSWIGIRETLAVAAVGSWLAVLLIVFSPLRLMREIPVSTDRIQLK